MVSFTDERFGKKAEKLIAKLSPEDNFFLGQWEDDRGAYTMFGNGYICFLLPGHIGEPVNQDRADSVLKLLRTKMWDEESVRNMRWVPLPKAADLKPGRDRENPVKCHLAATDLEVGREEEEPCATYPFSVQARYLKAALELALFSGHKDVRSIYNPLCLWAKDDSGNQITGLIMPMRE